MMTTGVIEGQIQQAEREGIMSEKVRQGLVGAVIEASVADTWTEAVIEWDVDGMAEDDSGLYSCLCGQQGLRYVYTIRNVENGRSLTPIGSECIRKFGRGAMVDDANRLRLLAEMRALAASGRPLDLKRDLTRARLRALHDGGLLDDWAYRFLLDLFNKRATTELSEKQVEWRDKKLAALAQRLRQTATTEGGAA